MKEKTLLRGSTGLTLTLWVLVWVSTLSAAPPQKVIEDIDTMLRDPNLLLAVASAQIDEVLGAFDDPVWGGQLSREIYSELPVHESTKAWLAEPDVQIAKHVMPLVVGALYQLEEVANTPGTRAALREVSRSVVAAAVADQLLAHREGDAVWLEDLIRTTRGNPYSPVAGLALQRMKAPPGYFRAFLEKADVERDLWICAEAARKLIGDSWRTEWLRTLRTDALLRIAWPTGPFDRDIQSKAVEVLEVRAPHTDWPEVIFQQESDLLAEFLSEMLSSPSRLGMPPVDLLQSLGLQLALVRDGEQRTITSILVQRAVDNSVLGRAVLSRKPETLVAEKEVKAIVDEVSADSEFFVRLLNKWDAVEQGLLIAAVLERIRGRPEVSDWLAALSDDELVSVASNEAGVLPRWIAETARDLLKTTESPLPR